MFNVCLVVILFMMYYDVISLYCLETQSEIRHYLIRHWIVPLTLTVSYQVDCNCWLVYSLCYYQLSLVIGNSGAIIAKLHFFLRKNNKACAFLNIFNFFIYKKTFHIFLHEVILLVSRICQPPGFLWNS